MTKTPFENDNNLVGKTPVGVFFHVRGVALNSRAVMVTAPCPGHFYFGGCHG